MSGRTVVLAAEGVVAVFRAWPPRCVVASSRPRATGDERCRQRTAIGIPGAPELVEVPGGRISAIRLEGDVAERLLAQRCFRHGDREWPIAAEVEWTSFDPDRDADLLEGKR